MKDRVRYTFPSHLTTSAMPAAILFFFCAENYWQHPVGQTTAGSGSWRDSGSVGVSASGAPALRPLLKRCSPKFFWLSLCQSATSCTPTVQYLLLLICFLLTALKVKNAEKHPVAVSIHSIWKGNVTLPSPACMSQGLQENLSCA